MKSIARLRKPSLILGLIVCLLAFRATAVAASCLDNIANLMVSSRWRPASAATAIPSCVESTGRNLDVSSVSALGLQLQLQNVRGWVNFGRAAWLTGHCKKAINSWQRAISLDTQETSAWFLYMQATGDQGTLPTPEVGAELVQIIYSRGEEAERLMRWEDALIWYKLAFHLYPEIEGANKLETVYVELEQVAEGALAWGELAATLPITSSDHWWAMGQLAELSEDWEHAAMIYSNGSVLAADPYDFLMRQGAAYRQLRDWTRAEQAFRSAAEANPRIFRPYLNVGHMLRQKENYKEAHTWYLKASTLAPDRWEPPYYLGQTYYLQHDYESAERYLKTALQMNPRHAGSAYNLAQCLYGRGEPETAIVWLNSAIDWHDGQPWRWAMQLGDWLVSMGKTEDALEAYHQALVWRPNDEEILRRAFDIVGSRP